MSFFVGFVFGVLAVYAYQHKDYIVAKVKEWRAK